MAGGEALAGGRAGPAGRNMELTAWLVLLGALGVFLLALVALPLGFMRFTEQATVTEQALVESKDGAVMVEATGGITQVLPVADPRGAAEGSTITTHPEAEAFVQLYNGSPVHLRSGTSLTLVAMRRPQFAVGGSLGTARLFARPANGGPAALTVGSANTPGRPLRLIVATPHGQVELDPDEKARLEITDEATKVFGKSPAEVTVLGAGGAVAVGLGERTTLHAGLAPEPPVSTPENLVLEPEFATDPAAGGPWSLELAPQDRFAAGGWQALPGGRTVLRFRREGSEGRPGDLLYRQDFAAYVADYSELSVTADLRVLAQSLAGGGFRASEFPLILRLIGEDQDREPVVWQTGFYATPPAAEDEASAPLDASRTVQVSPGEWAHFDSGNLFSDENPRGYAAMGLERPMRLHRLEVKASGHDLESELDAVGVWVK
jgi:hypothetical protein